MKRKYFFWVVAAWTLVILISFLWNIDVNQRGTDKIVRNRGQAFFRQIVATREWNSYLGGVFAPKTGFNQPNPYLAESIREIMTVDSQPLVRINPAYMTRQIAEMNQYPPHLYVHLTSLKPIRPANKPDDWETGALQSFRSRTDEILAYIKTDSFPLYRYMAPLITEKSCLACHAAQGYHEGDIRGGISISFPAEIFKTAQSGQFQILLWAHLFILVLGIFGIYSYFKMSGTYLAQLKQKNRDLYMLNTKKDKLFSIIAHDLKNPFNSIIGLSDLLVDHSEELEEKEKGEFLVSIQQTSKNAFQLLENLLGWAMSELKKIPFNPGPTEPSQLIESSIQLIHLSARNKNITLVNRVPEQIRVTADKNMLATIFRNLITNAVKYSYPGGTVEVSHSLQPGKHVFLVSDRGVGMTPEQKEKLFNLGCTSTFGTNNEKGTGLGLILCKEFVEKHGGQIWVDTEPGKGSTFNFTIPEQEVTRDS